MGSEGQNGEREVLFVTTSGAPHASLPEQPFAARRCDGASTSHPAPGYISITTESDSKRFQFFLIGFLLSLLFVCPRSICANQHDKVNGQITRQEREK